MFDVIFFFLYSLPKSCVVDIWLATQTSKSSASGKLTQYNQRMLQEYSSKKSLIFIMAETRVYDIFRYLIGTINEFI